MNNTNNDSRFNLPYAKDYENVKVKKNLVLFYEKIVLHNFIINLKI